MKEKNFEEAWIQEYERQGNRRNGIVAPIALLAGTILILPDVLLTDHYSFSLLIMRLGVSFIGFIGFMLFRFEIISNILMILSYIIPMFILSAYMVAIEPDLFGVMDLTTTLAIVGIFLVAVTILPSWSWIVIDITLIGSYFFFILIIGNFSIEEYLNRGGILTVIGFLTFPVVAYFRYRHMRESYFLQYQIQNQKEELEYYANNDLLTSTFNRRGGMNILNQAIQMSERHQIPLTISFIDIDGLKNVNDLYGHSAGDELIKSVAAILKENIRVSDTVFRVGGDEFIIIFPGCNYENGLEIMKKIETARVQFNNEAHQINPVRFSTGVAEHQKKQTIDDLISRADKLMYKDKQGQD